MRSPFYFIVKPLDDKRYTNTKEIDGMDFITSTSEENHMASNRQGVVVATPLGYDGDIEVGDLLLVHHNVFKYYNDMKGRQKSGKSFFKDDLFLWVEAIDEQHSQLFARSASRVGKGDLGANTRHLMNLFAMVDAMAPVSAVATGGVESSPGNSSVVE